MWLWWLMFGMDLIVPVVMILVGRMMWKHYPKEINDILGYRTKRSMKNKDTWKFAHEYCGQLWWKVGWILLAPTVLAQILLLRCRADVLPIWALGLMLLQTAVMLVTIAPTEHALQKKFDEAGNLRPEP